MRLKLASVIVLQALVVAGCGTVKPQNDLSDVFADSMGAVAFTGLALSAYTECLKSKGLSDANLKNGRVVATFFDEFSFGEAGIKLERFEIQFEKASKNLIIKSDLCVLKTKATSPAAYQEAANAVNSQAHNNMESVLAPNTKKDAASEGIFRRLKGHHLQGRGKVFPVLEAEVFDETGRIKTKFNGPDETE